MRILTINPGSTTTKIAVFDDEEEVLSTSIVHRPEELEHFTNAIEQYEWRLQLVLDTLQENHQPLDFKAVVGRGSLAKPVEGGVYEVNDQMVHDARHALHKHACDLGCMIAQAIAKMIPGCLSLIADPGDVDELCDEVRLSGSPLLPNYCIWHALNQRAIARRFARERGKRYEDFNLIICHLGGGISIAAHQHGRAIDANNALDGDGPFSPERGGTLPAGDLIRLCFSGKFTEDELLRHLMQQTGVTAYLGTNDMVEVEHRILAGDEKARKVIDAMVYHTAKHIVGDAAALYGKVDAIILTGGIAHFGYVVEGIKKRVEWLAPVYVYPGQDEMRALAENGLEVLRGNVQVKKYQ